MSLNHLTSQAQPQPLLHPRFQSLVVDSGVRQALPVQSVTSSSFACTSGISGSIVSTTTASVNVAISLPAVAPGLAYNFRFPLAGDGTHSQSISAAGMDAIYGNGTPLHPFTGGGSITRSASIGAIGDQLDLTSDGVVWYAKAVSAGSSAAFS